MSPIQDARGPGQPRPDDAAAAADDAAADTTAEAAVVPGQRRNTSVRPGAWPSRAEASTALRRTPVSIWNDDVMDWAAALTYYAVLAIFPALLVTVSIVGSAATQELIAQATALLPAGAGDALAAILRDMARRQTAAWLLAVFGSAGSLWSACSYLSVFRRALHTMHGVKDHRPVLRKAPRILLTALALLALLVTSAFVLVASAEVARTTGRLLGTGQIALEAWSALRWPLLLCLVAVLVLVLFRSGPSDASGVRVRVLGGVLAVALWLAASAAFAFYTSHASTYPRLYGSLAGVVVFLVWLWVTNLAFLAGAQFTAEVAKLRRGGDGSPHE